MHIIYEDKNLLVIDKPAGVVVHEGAGHIRHDLLVEACRAEETGKTLVDLVMDKYPEMKNLQWPDTSRPGIVHRLDKDTSGLMVVAKNPTTQKFLQEQFKDRTTSKIYLALVLGQVTPQEGKIIANIGRDQNNRLQQRVTPMVFSWTKGKTRPAETHYKVIKSYQSSVDSRQLSLLEVRPLTGRMHQIRVHLKYLGYPIIGDPIYNTKESKKISKELNLDRQFLHAHKLKIKLPSGSEKEFTSNLSGDLQKLLEKLK